MRKNGINKDYYGGVLIIAIGLGAVLGGVSYRIGTLRQMGPGFFPAAVGALMVLMGVLIAIQGLAHKHADADAEPDPPAEWRGWLCIVGGIVAFILLGDYGGLLPATFGVVFISALGDRQNSIKEAAVLAVAGCLVSTIIFWWMLQLQFPLLHWG
ncbi:MAG: tripartite tricarboxylate transporter TctB family protein [Burkholderiaceae bacterium]|nr:MAG: tripartite tricarboxylate transporter TctB family protein [Burkholderiaceae bacterium]TAM09718.1 MAG: tripartite tricarboxylate transporter TctB family protein [Pusillimonas sp.]